MKRLIWLVAITAAAACLDPLYADGDPSSSGWETCCRAGFVDTCACDDPSGCNQPAFAPCEGGTCSQTFTCDFAQDAGAGGGGGAFGGGGGASAGGGAGGGEGDAGFPGDAGAQDGGASGGGAGGGGGAQDGGPPIGGGGGGLVYELCCVSSRVTTCRCDPSGCTHAPYTSCAQGTCVAGTTHAACR